MLWEVNFNFPFLIERRFIMNELFTAKKEELEAKYDERIRGIAIENDVDLGVAFDMLVANAERGTAYPGAGNCTVEEWAEIVKDVADLRALGRG